MPELQPYRGLPSQIERAIKESEEKGTLTEQQRQQLRRASSMLSSVGGRRTFNPVVIALTVIWGFASFALFFMADEIFPTGLGFISYCVTGVLWFGGMIVIMVGGSIITNRMVRSRLSEPVMQASSGELRRGDKLDITFIQDVKKQTNIESVEIKFLMRETATYTSGTDTVTVTHDHLHGHEQREGRVMQTGYMLEERASFQVPPDAMHTFIAANNKIQWFVKIKIAIPMFPDFNETYELLMLPETAESEPEWG